MNEFERTPPTSSEVSDYEDEIFFPLLKTLPKEVALQAISRIENLDMDDTEAVTFLEGIHHDRKEAVTKTHFSDPRFQEFAEKYEGDLMKHIEEELFSDTSKQIGHGMTAKVHELDTEGKFLPTAVKYLVKPAVGTISTESEHNIIREVERISTLERLVKQDESIKHIRVPHPFFHHATDKIQCYGMEKIKGVNLQSAISGAIPAELEAGLDNNNFTDTDIADFDAEVDNFFEIVHSYCLHGSIKPDNMMIDDTGKIFIIDFGNSTLLADVQAGDEDWVETKKLEEVKSAKTAIHTFLNSYKQLKDSQSKKLR